MQTITLSKTEQMLVTTTAKWVEEQHEAINRIANERLASILEDHDILGKQATFSLTEKGWVLRLPQEKEDATQEG